MEYNFAGYYCLLRKEKTMGCLGYLIIVGVIMIIIEAVIGLLPIIVPTIIIVIILYQIIKHNPVEMFLRFKLNRFEKKYYQSEEFISVRQKVQQYIKNCNNLNEHIEELKNVHLGTSRLDFGKANYYDTSDYNYERPEYLNQSYGEQIHNCSRNVCDNARMQPFKYVCKYFNIKPIEENLSEFENLLNNFEAAIEGADLLDKEKRHILYGIENEIPPIIKKYGYDRFQYELGFRIVGLGELSFPKYTFQYISPGGNASTKCDIIMDIENLNRFIHYLSENIKFRQSVAGQRALLTSSLRKKILLRDNYTCKKCGNSASKEPNLLLEIDHIIPLAKGGMTSEDNLQVLCWRCNRSKGAKIE